VVSSAIYSIVDNQKLDKELCQTINGIINRLDPWAIGDRENLGSGDLYTSYLLLLQN
jgi:hypothetical protein